MAHPTVVITHSHFFSFDKLLWTNQVFCIGNDLFLVRQFKEVQKPEK